MSKYEKELQECVNKIKALTDSPEPGLYTWTTFLMENTLDLVKVVFGDTAEITTRRAS